MGHLLALGWNKEQQGNLSTAQGSVQWGLGEEPLLVHLFHCLFCTQGLFKQATTYTGFKIATTGKKAMAENILP